MKLFAQLFILIWLMGHPSKTLDAITLINQQRQLKNIPTLSESITLDATAEAKCLDMINRNYWSHFAPDGTSPWYFFDMFNYNFKYAGENLVRDYSNDYDRVYALMGSPTHRANILNPEFLDIGIGRCNGKIDGVETNIMVQHFGTRLNYGDTK